MQNGIRISAGITYRYIIRHLLVFDVLALHINDDVEKVITLGPRNWRRNNSGKGK